MAKRAKAEDSPTERDVELELRQMALVDRVLGLEAEVARLRKDRDEVERLRIELQEVYGSRSWILGSAMVRMTHPFRGSRAK